MPSLRRLLPYAVVVVGLALRLHGLTFQSLWRDEIDALRFAQSATVTSLSQLGWNGPLYTWLLGAWVRYTGASEFALRFSSLLPGVLLLSVIYRLGCRLTRVDERSGVGPAGVDTAALLATALAAVSPYLVWYAQELKMYALLALLGAASTALLLRALDRGGVLRWGAYVAVTGIIPYVHVLGVLLIPAQALAYLAAWPRRRPRLVPFAASLGILVLPYLPLAAWQAPLLLSAFQTGHPYYPLAEMLSILARGWTLGILASARPLLLAPFALAAVGLAFRPRLDSSVRFLLCWMAAPILAVHLISLRSPVFTDRYLIASLPALILLLALGAERTYSRLRPLGVVLAISLLAVSLYGVRMQASYSIKTDARGAADIVRAGWQEGDVLVTQIPYLRHSLDYYLGPGYPLLEGPYTNDGASAEGVSRYLQTGVEGHGRAWLLLSEAEMWDQRGLTEAWFEQHADQQNAWELARVRLILFDLR